MSATHTATLPFPPLGEVLSRDKSREYKIGTGDESIYVDLSILDMRPGSNGRKPSPYQTHEQWLAELNIEELAMGIYASNGPADLILGDMAIPDGATKAKFYIIEGQRRWMALQWLVKNGKTTYPNGKPVASVLVRRTDPKMSEFDRLRLGYTAQNKMPLKTSQEAARFKMIKDHLRKEDGTEYTNDEIGEAYGVSRQTVDNMIKINDLDPETLRRLDNKEISIQAALAPLRKKREPKPENIVQVDKETGEIIAPEDVANIDDLEEGVDYEPVPGGIKLINGRTWKEQAGETIVITPTVVDKSSSLQQEEESRKTSAKAPTPEDPGKREAKENQEAMVSIDFKPHKIQGEFLINEIKKNQDKIETIISKFPKHLAQYIDDVTQLMKWNEHKLNELLDILKKAADSR